jgi:hypothetical protein
MKTSRKKTVRLQLEALENRLMPATLLNGGIVAPVGPIATPDWFASNLNDPAMQTLARTEYNRDGMINRMDMLQLFAQAESNSAVASNEFHDLAAIVAAGRNGVLSMPDNVANLAGKVVNGDPDNATYHYVQGYPQAAYYVGAGTASAINPGSFHSITLGNLQAGSPTWKLQDLVNKWFYGMDLPSASTYINGAWVYRPWGLDTQATLFGNGISFGDIRQGAAGDGFFLGAVATLANQSPATIYNNFIDNADGTYTVRFFNSDGSTNYVTVNRWLPEHANGTFIYANKDQSLSDPNVNLWAALYEKAFIEANASAGRGQWQLSLNTLNSYTFDFLPNALSRVWGFPSDALPHLTGSGASHNNPFSDQAAFTHLVDSNQTLVCLAPVSLLSSGNIYSVEKIDGFTITPSTTYAMLGHDPVSGLFTVFNPFGLGNGFASGMLHLTWQQIKDIFLEYDTGAFSSPMWMAHLTTPTLVSQAGVTASSSLQIPNLAGVTFGLSPLGSPYGGELAIQTETQSNTIMNGYTTATFTGTWTDDNGGGAQEVSGLLYRDSQGNLLFATGWNTGPGIYYQDTLSGTITTVYNSRYLESAVNGYHYHMEADLWIGNGPGQNESYEHLAGDGALPPPLLAL